MAPPPVPSPSRPLSDLEGYVLLRRKFLAPRKRQFIRLNGSVLTVHTNSIASAECQISILHATIAHSLRRCTLVLTLPTTSKLFIFIDDRHLFDRWLVALQLAVSRDFHAFYTLREKIGEGAFATVHRAVCVTTGRTVAVKCIKKKQFDSITARELDREMFAMRHLRHSNIVSTHDVFNTFHHVYIVMDFMPGGTMKDNVQAHGGRIPERFARPVMHQVLTACAFLHRHGYVHRDVKLENVLCQNSRFPIQPVRLADFGYVNFVDDPRHACLRSLLGTPVYIAPEIIRRKPYGAAVDVYAMGVMLYRMISGHYPYDGRDDDDRTLDLAVQARLMLNDPAWRRTSKECRSFVRALLQPQPERRLTAATAMLHPWMADYTNAACQPDAIQLQDNGTATMKYSRACSNKVVPGRASRHALDSEAFLTDGGRARSASVVEGGVLLSPVTPALSHDEDGSVRRAISQPGILGINVTKQVTKFSRLWAKRSGVSTFMEETCSSRVTDDGTGNDCEEASHDQRWPLSEDCTVAHVTVSCTEWSTNVDSIRKKVRKAAIAVRFTMKLAVLSGVKAAISTWDVGGDADEYDEGLLNGDFIREVLEQNVGDTVHVRTGWLGFRRRDSRRDYRERCKNKEKVGGDGIDSMHMSRQASGNASSVGMITGLVSRAASNHRSDKSRRWGGTFGDKLKRTMSMGKR